MNISVRGSLHTSQINSLLHTVTVTRSSESFCYYQPATEISTPWPYFNSKLLEPLVWCTLYMYVCSRIMLM